MARSDKPADFSIREATAADRAAVIALHDELQRVERRIHPNRAPVEEISAAAGDEIYADFTNHDGRILVAEVAGHIVGCVVYQVSEEGEAYLIESDRTFGYVRSIAVAEDHRSTGVGEALMAATEAEFRRRGVAQMQVGVLCGNAGARRFYSRLGYQPYEMTYEKRFDSLQVPAPESTS